ncbi:TPA: hypothetical protein HA239_04855 [Candidatus Woesearchaeota archaeon]|nr:hypothetical protein QT06_C0001G0369 [archaeon GW2011_AR15]MBS3103684.1 hypothetical protein [Candidatus Woesearchaeota archaeon]HIH41714.1 hypothetical protein [Candidatus Woesearchaeota archaeon]
MKLKFMPNVPGVLLMTAFFILVSALLYALPLWLIWNWVIPKIFGLPSLTILDAFLLNLLAGILFRGKDK